MTGKRGWLRWKIGRYLRRLRRADVSEEEAYARASAAEFAKRYRAVCDACEQLRGSGEAIPEHFAADYMARVLEEKDPDWWRVNGGYCVQPWFLWEYGIAHQLIDPPEHSGRREIDWRVIHPETAVRGDCVRIRLEREKTNGQQGRLWLNCGNGSTALGAWLAERGFVCRDGLYGRRVGENAAPLLDRAAEVATGLLEKGYSVCVDEPLLEKMILEHGFVPEHKLWVLAPSRVDSLRLEYPQDPALHRYVCRAGGRWNGKYMEISIYNADKLEELMALYGFRATKEARRRMDAWREAVQQGTIYRAQHMKEAPALPFGDLFKAILNRKSDVPEDLLESDE